MYQGQDRGHSTTGQLRQPRTDAQGALQTDAAQAAVELEAFKALKARGSHKRRSLWIRVSIIVAVVLALSVGAFFLLKDTLFPPAEETALLTEEVTRGDFDEVIDSSGSLAAWEQVTITPEIDGTVAEVRVAQGDSVTAGQVLFTIDSPEIEQQVSAAQRSVDAAYVSYNGALADLSTANAGRDAAYQAYLDTHARPPASDTDEELNKQATPEQAYEAYLSAQKQANDAQTAANQALLQIEEAQATLRQAQEATAKREIISPIAGQVIASNIERGTKLSTLAAAGKAPMQIVNMSSMLISVPISETDILKLEIGQRATVGFDALEDYSAEATVRTVATTPVGGSEGSLGGGGGIVSYQVDLLIENPDPRLRIGMSAHATIFIKSYTNVLLVSSFALRESGGGATVTVVDHDGSQRLVPVTVIAHDGSQAAIEGPLQPGDVLAITINNEDESSMTGSSSLLRFG